MSGMLPFSPLTIRGAELRNRSVVPPMHQYSAVNAALRAGGCPFGNVPPQFGYWLGTRARRGFGTQRSTWQNGLNDTRKVL